MIINRIAIGIKWVFRLNVCKTLLLNFKMLPLHQAIHMPVLIFGRCILHNMDGKIEIHQSQVRFGMIKIGYRDLDLMPSSYLPVQLFVLGRIVFAGEAIISGGVGLFAQRKNAVISIGESCRIGGGTIIKSMDDIAIGDNTGITSNCIIMNSNMHYVKNIDTGIIQRPWGKIIIGKNCWINSGTVIAKGTILPNFSITSRNSFLDKDYSEYGENTMLVGSPAKVMGNKVQRIFSRKKEIELNQFFMSHPDDTYIYVGEGKENEQDYNVF